MDAENKLHTSLHETTFFKNILLNLSGQFLPAVVGLATLPFVMRKMGMEEFGILSLAYTLLVTLTLFDFGMSRATIHLVSSHLARGRTEALSTIVWTSFLSHLALGILGGFILSWTVSPLVENFLTMNAAIQSVAKTAFWRVAVAIPFVLTQNVLRGTLEGAGRFDLVNLVKIPLNSLIFLLPAALLFVDMGLLDLILALVALQILASLAYLFLSLDALPWFKRSPSFQSSWVLQLMSFGSWVTVSAVVGPILLYLDRFLLGNLTSLAMVPFYVVPYEAVTRLLLIPSSLAFVLFPMFASLHANLNDTEAVDLYTRSTKYILLMMGPFVAILLAFSGVILHGILGQDFADQSTEVLKILSFAVLINAIAWVPYVFLQGTGRPDIPAKFHLIELPIHFIVSIMLIRSFGANGAALAWMIRALFDMLLLCGAAFRRLKSLPSLLTANLGSCLWTLSGFVLAVTFVSLSTLSLSTQAGVVLLSFILYGFTVWKQVLDDFDRSAIRATARRFFVKGEIVPDDH